MKLKLADALPIEDESADIVPCQVSPLRPYLSSPNVNSFSSSDHPQSPTPNWDPAAKYPPLQETDRYAYLEIGESPSKHSEFSEKQVELAVFCDNEETPLANGVDFSGETLVEDLSLPTAYKGSRSVIRLVLRDYRVCNACPLGCSSSPNP